MIRITARCPNCQFVVRVSLEAVQDLYCPECGTLAYLASPEEMPEIIKEIAEEPIFVEEEKHEKPAEEITVMEEVPTSRLHRILYSVGRLFSRRGKRNA
jgi:phage FluMu protein Com